MVTATTFADLGVSEPVARALAEAGIHRPFPVQALALPDALAGRDVLVRSPTGSGKTLAFAVPIVERLGPDAPTPSALVLAPTRELAAQVAEAAGAPARARGLAVAVAYGGVPLREQARAAARAHVLVATPGRLEDLAGRRLVDLSRVSVLVLDEADRMLDLGFQPQVDRIVRRLPVQRQTMFFSATLDGEVGRLARAYTRAHARHEVAAPAPTAPGADHRFLPVDPHGKVEALVELLALPPGAALGAKIQALLQQRQVILPGAGVLVFPAHQFLEHPREQARHGLAAAHRYELDAPQEILGQREGDVRGLQPPRLHE